MGLGVKLARASIAAMWTAGCAEAVLEAEMSNVAALRLYRGLGFFRDKLLMRYYLGGQNAVRLKLLAPLNEGSGEKPLPSEENAPLNEGSGEKPLSSEENAEPQARAKSHKSLE